MKNLSGFNFFFYIIFSSRNTASSTSSNGSSSSDSGSSSSSSTAELLYDSITREDYKLMFDVHVKNILTKSYLLLT